MTLEVVRAALGWCTLINFGFLLTWWLGLVIAHDWIFRFHGKWFKSLTAEHFDAIHYAGMAFYKLSIFLFFMIPYLALRIVG